MTYQRAVWAEECRAYRQSKVDQKRSAVYAMRARVSPVQAVRLRRGGVTTRERTDGGRGLVDEPDGAHDGPVTDKHRAPQVLMRRPDDGDSIVLPMGDKKAHITRKAARTETGGHWSIGEAWQQPGFDNPPHTHDEAEAFYVLDGWYTFYTDAEPAEDVGPGTFILIPPGAVHGFRTGPDGGRLLCIWPATVEAAFFGRDG